MERSRNKWIEDVDSCTGGKFEFNLFESNPKASTAQETPTAIVNIPHQIPQPPADFTGRNDDLKYLLDRFNQGATITGLRGMGGIGKTALAFMLAEKLIDRYPDGQILVNMNGTSDEPLTASDAMAQIIHAYDIDARLPPIESELSGLYRSMLHNKKVLILLDNVANEDQVRPLLSSVFVRIYCDFPREIHFARIDRKGSKCHANAGCLCPLDQNRQQDRRPCGGASQAMWLPAIGIESSKQPIS